MGNRLRMKPLSKRLSLGELKRRKARKLRRAGKLPRVLIDTGFEKAYTQTCKSFLTLLRLMRARG